MNNKQIETTLKQYFPELEKKMNLGLDLAFSQMKMYYKTHTQDGAGNQITITMKEQYKQAYPGYFTAGLLKSLSEQINKKGNELYLEYKKTKKEEDIEASEIMTHYPTIQEYLIPILKEKFDIMVEEKL